MSDDTTSVADAPQADNPAEAATVETVDTAVEDPQGTVQEGHDTGDDAEDGEIDLEDTRYRTVPKGLKKRIDTLTRQKYEKDARIAELESELAQATRKPEPKEPHLDDFETYADYTEALVNHKAEQKVREQQARQQAEMQQQKRTADFMQRSQAFASGVKDFAEAITAVPDALLPPPLVEAVMDMEEGPQVAYYLAKNLKTLAEIGKLSPLSQARELGRLAERLSSKQSAASPPPPPPPPPTLGGKGGPVQKDIGSMTDAEYAAFRRQQDIKAGRRRA